jgi:predicted amidohydrolase
MRLSIIQTNPVFGEIHRNIYTALEQMKSVNADFFVLPELFNTGYNFISKNEVEQFSETAEGQTFQEIAMFTKKKNCYCVYGFAEKETDNDSTRYFNSSALVGPDGLIGVYRKVHLFYKENIFFSPGNLGFPVFETPIGKIGMMICFDWYYPESARTLALKGALLIAHPSNLVMPHCPDAMITRCIENRIFAATANRVGGENRGEINLNFIGKSEIVSPRGKILVRLGEHEAESAVEKIELTEARQKKLNEYNDIFEGRREELYFR